MFDRRTDACLYANEAECEDSERELLTEPEPDCKGKEDGNYPYRGDCTRFVACHKGVAHVMDCGLCDVDPEKCPQGRLSYDYRSDQCLYAYEAECAE